MAEAGAANPKLLAQAYQELNAGYVDLLGAMSVLRSLSAISVAGIGEAELLSKALQVLVLNHDMERCSVFLAEGDLLINAGGLDWPDLIGIPRSASGSAPRQFRVGEGLVGIAASTGVLQHCRNCLEDHRFVSHGAGGSDGTVGSIIAVPIRANGENLGVLNVSHPHTEFFSVGHERALQVFANFLGQMIVNRRLLGRMDSLVRERTDELEKALREAEILKQRYAEMSAVDDLTGLYNRRHFFPAARTALARSLRNGTQFSVILLDVDHFKLINDTFGHAGGDQVLSEFAALLRRECREADILARFGGEEFIIGLPDTDVEGARMLAERIRLAVKAWRGNVEGRAMQVTASLGVACLGRRSGAGDSPESLLESLIREADQALYFGKHNGRDQYRLYQDIACFL